MFLTSTKRWVIKPEYGEVFWELRMKRDCPLCLFSADIWSVLLIFLSILSAETLTFLWFLWNAHTCEPICGTRIFFQGKFCIIKGYFSAEKIFKNILAEMVFFAKFTKNWKFLLSLLFCNLSTTRQYLKALQTAKTRQLISFCFQGLSKFGDNFSHSHKNAQNTGFLVRKMSFCTIFGFVTFLASSVGLFGTHLINFFSF